MDPAAPAAHTYVDTHAHFMDDSTAGEAEIVERARSAGVRRILAPAIDLNNCETVLRVANAHECVFAAVGIHPNHVTPADDVSRLGDLARDSKVKAIGETGLDYYRVRTDPQLQRSHLDRHMKLAATLGLPIILHNRNADDDILAIARRYTGQVRGILHCFSATLSLAEEFLSLGYYISFAGNLTYPSAAGLREMVPRLPRERLLTETDSPYLAPVPFRGTRNEPARVAATAATLAESAGMELGALLECVEANAAQLLGW